MSAPTPTEILRRRLPASAFKDSQKFAAKLNFEKRCAILALERISGVSRPVLAAAFGVNRGTVAYICNNSSPHYKDVRREYNELGRDAFERKYLTEEIIDRIAEVTGDPETQMTDAELRAFKASQGITPPRKSADAHAGTWAVLDAFFFKFQPGKIDIVWFEEESEIPEGVNGKFGASFDGPGWYCIIHDPEQGNFLNYESEPGSTEKFAKYRSSKAALDSAKATTSGEYERSA